MRNALANNKNVIEKRTKELQQIRGTYVEIISWTVYTIVHTGKKLFFHEIKYRNDVEKNEIPFHEMAEINLGYNGFEPLHRQSWWALQNLVCDRVCVCVCEGGIESVPEASMGGLLKRYSLLFPWWPLSRKLMKMQSLTSGEWGYPFNNGTKLAVAQPNSRWKTWKSEINGSFRYLDFFRDIISW